MTNLQDIVKSSYASSIARLFTAPVIRELATAGNSKLGARILFETGARSCFASEATLEQMYTTLFQALSRWYRNEYVYKNMLTQRVLLGRHSLNTSFMLTEFRVADCKADAVLLNGTSNVYEIKSEYDSLERLSRQLIAYRKVFDSIHVVTSEGQASKVESAVGSDIGIIILSKRNALSTLREASSNMHIVCPSVIFNSLRKGEYESIIRCQFGAVPDVPNTHSYRVCHTLFEKLAPHEAHDGMVAALKKRGRSTRLQEFISSVPSPLKATSLSCRLSHLQQERLLETMAKPIGHCFSV